MSGYGDYDDGPHVNGQAHKVTYRGRRYDLLYQYVRSDRIDVVYELADPDATYCRVCDREAFPDQLEELDGLCVGCHLNRLMGVDK